MPSATSPERTRWAVVLVLVAGGIVAALHVGKVPPALPALRADFGLGLTSAGFVVSLFNVLSMTLGVLTGVMADRLGRRRLLLVGLACLAVGGGLGATGEGFPALLTSRVLEGFGFMTVSVASPALVMAATATRDRSLALSLWSIFMPAGMALAMVTAPVALDIAGWRGLWLGIALIALVAVVVVGMATRGLPSPAPPAGSPWRVLGESLGRPALLFLALTFGAYAFQWVAVMVWLPTFLPSALGVAAPTAALLTALVVVMNVPGNLTGGWLLRRARRASPLIITASLIMAVCAAGLFLPVLPPLARFGVVLLFSFVGGLIPAALFSSVPAEAPSPRHMAAANGLLMQGSNVGQFLGPPLLASAVTAAGGAWSAALIPALIAAAVCVAAVSIRERVRPPGG